MDQDRRKFLSLSTFMPIVAALPLASLLAPASAFAQRGAQSKLPGLQTASEDPAPAAPSFNPAESKLMLQQNQEQMKRDIDKLYNLVKDLKQQVDRTDSTTVLSLNLVDSAKKVEDLAKQIRNLARS